MPAPIVVAKAALVIGKEVQKRIPGGWVTIIVIALVASLAVPMMIFQGVMGAIDPFFRGTDNTVCATPISNNNDGTSSEEGTDKPATAGTWSTAGTPWPKEDSKTVSYPTPNPALSSPYGYRPPFLVNGIMTPGWHNGLDFGQGLGTPVLSMADGVVASAENGTSPYGSHISIKHTVKGKHITSMYGHIQGPSIKVKVGQVVKAGEQIAQIGQEGMSTGPHLHFVLTQGDYSVTVSEPGWNGGDGGNSIDPASFLSSNGAVTAAGGIKGDNFEGITTDADISCEAGGKGSEQLEGDGFGSWGGFKNGEITGIKTVSFDSQASLIARAASDLAAMNVDFKKEFGRDLIIASSYRSLDKQKEMYDAKMQTEKPGLSAYGWGRLVSFNLGMQGGNDGAGYQWLQKNASKYGYAQPDNQDYKKMQGADGKYVSIWGYRGGGDGGDIPPASTADAEKSRQIAKGILEKDHGWGQSEYVCLVKLWEHESNWNYTAENPTSGAYGIVQALPPDKMNSVATDWRTNASTQIIWGLQYIEERYKTPCGAWEFWQETDPAKKSGYPGNWY